MDRGMYILLISIAAGTKLVKRSLRPRKLACDSAPPVRPVVGDYYGTRCYEHPSDAPGPSQARGGVPSMRHIPHIFEPSPIILFAET